MGVNKAVQKREAKGPIARPAGVRKPGVAPHKNTKQTRAVAKTKDAQDIQPTRVSSRVRSHPDYEALATGRKPGAQETSDEHDATPSPAQSESTSDKVASPRSPSKGAANIQTPVKGSSVSS